jgi:hypothetical protein
MAHHELFALDSNPHDSDLRAAIGVERRQMGERPFVDHCAYCLRNRHGCLSFDASGWTLVVTAMSNRQRPIERLELENSPIAQVGAIVMMISSSGFAAWITKSGLGGLGP